MPIKNIDTKINNSTENSNQNQSVNKKPLIKILIPFLILVLVFVGIFWVIRGNQKPKDQIQGVGLVDSTQITFKKLDELKPQAEAAKEEGDRLSQVLNAELRARRLNAETGKEFNWYMGWVSVQAMKESGVKIPVLKEAESGKVDLPKDLLRDIIPAPKNPQKKNFLIYEKYGVEAPIIQAGLNELFLENEDGTINFNRRIDTDSVNSPMQKRLEKGIVHLPISPQPGEIGNSYISGHSSNYDFVQSNFNTVFKPLEKATQIGETFVIYDWEGRKLTFEVFEVLEVPDGDADKAWEYFEDKRVVSLQASILENINGRLLPTKRWITRGKLLVEKSKADNINL